MAVGIEPIRYADRMSRTSFIRMVEVCAPGLVVPQSTHPRYTAYDGPSAGGPVVHSG